jgi:hypothetical protein
MRGPVLLPATSSGPCGPAHTACPTRSAWGGSTSGVETASRIRHHLAQGPRGTLCTRRRERQAEHRGGRLSTGGPFPLQDQRNQLGGDLEAAPPWRRPALAVRAAECSSGSIGARLQTLLLLRGHQEKGQAQLAAIAKGSENQVDASRHLGGPSDPSKTPTTSALLPTPLACSLVGSVVLGADDNPLAVFSTYAMRIDADDGSILKVIGLPSLYDS